MSPSNARCALLAVICTALLALTPSAFGAAQVRHGNGAATDSGTAPIVVTHGGAVRGVAVAGGYAFRGLPYAAAPTGDLRWRPPRSPAPWSGNFACTAMQVDRWTSARVPTFAYQFNDDTAPQIFAGPGFPPIATHSAEIQYLFDQPNAPFAAPLDAVQETLAASMRRAWADFAATGDPTAAVVPWPSFNAGSDVLSLISPQPQVSSTFASVHHCAFWGAG